MQMKDRKKPRQMSLVWLSPHLPKRRYPFLKEHALVFLGEIPNMHGWCALAGCETGRIYAPYQISHFVEVGVKKAKP
jgi:hypothetical protein